MGQVAIGIPGTSIRIPDALDFDRLYLSGIWLFLASNISLWTLPGNQFESVLFQVKILLQVQYFKDVCKAS